MAEWLSEGDRERIRQFAETPMYERDPDMLVPESEDEPEE